VSRSYRKLWDDVLCRRDLSAPAKLIYAIIADRIGRNGFAWPGERRLALDSGMSRNTVRRALKALEAAGLLAVEHGTEGRPNLYRLNGGGAESEPGGAESEPGGVVPNRRRGGAGSAPQPVPDRPHNLNNQTHNQRKRRAKRSGGPFLGNELPPALDVPDFLTAWDEWQTHRREIRKPLTPTSVKRQLATLADQGPTVAVAMIRKSIERGWTGLFAPDAPKGKQPADDDGDRFADLTHPMDPEEAAALLRTPA